MADNIGVPVENDPSGTQTEYPLAFDEIGGVFYPRGKLSLGADGAAVDAVGGAGNVDTGTQRVTLGNDDPLVAATGAKADAAAGTDTGTFSVIAFLKRLMQKLTTQLPAGLGQTTKSESLPVAIASDQDALAVTVAAGATSAKQSDGSQKTQIVDGGGNVIAATSNALHVHIASGGGGGTEYTEGDTDATITGGAALAEGPSNTLTPLQLNASGQLKVEANPIAGQAGVAGGAGSVSALTQRVVVASDDAVLGAVNETAPGTDTASSGLNGRLQRIAQRITSLIGLLPSALTSLGYLKVCLLPETSGGLSIFRSLSVLASSQTIKGSAGQLFNIHAVNQHATNARYLKVYDHASPTVGTTTPVMTLVVPPNYGGIVFQSTHGFVFSTAITIAATTAIADADTNAPSANDVVVNAGYK